MLKIRLRRMGSTHKPFYRVVVSDSRRTPTSAALDEIGFYEPKKDPSIIKIDLERVEYWQSRGAQLSDAVHKLVRTVRNAPAEPAAAEETAAPAETAPAETAPAEETPAPAPPEAAAETANAADAAEAASA